MRSFNRRQLLTVSTHATGAAVGFFLLPRPLTAMLGGRRPELIPSIQDDRVKALVLRGLDAAQTAGATYADIRLTHTKDRGYGNGVANPGNEMETLHVGVRALVNGYWGFATSPVWSPEELTRLGREAVRQAKANTLGKTRDILLPPAVPVRDGHWETPIEIDPFAFHPDEITDHIHGITQQLRVMVMQMSRHGEGLDAGGNAFYNVILQSKAFGSTDGSYVTQRIYRSEGVARVADSISKFSGSVSLTPTGAGWELFRKSPIVELVHKDILHNQEMDRLPWKPLDVGRYATILDAKSVANLLSQTIGTATQLDRALGYEANAGGTSYLVEPETMLGTFQVGGPSLMVTANRTEPGGTATTRWDDEGTEPTDFTLIDRGVVTDFQTSREGAGWLKPRYDQLQRSFRSNGCVYSETAKHVPSIHTPNLVMQPAATAVSHRDLETGLDKGMSLVDLGPVMDFQAINGYSARFSCFEIVKGKRVARIGGAGLLFRTPELWKSITGIGGPDSRERFGVAGEKGEPKVYGYHSVTAVPVALKEITFIDSGRR